MEKEIDADHSRLKRELEAAEKELAGGLARAPPGRRGPGADPMRATAARSASPLSAVSISRHVGAVRLGSVAVHPLSGSSAPGRSAAFLVLLAFLLSFLFIRTSARMIRAQVSWWPGNVETGSGLHLHHLVWGISLMLIGGFSAFALKTPAAPWYQISAILFGVGGGLTFDEFALWIHLRDVYWGEQGRTSLDAVVLVTVFMALVVLGTKPFGLNGTESLDAGAVVVGRRWCFRSSRS